ncbi:MAG TPA: alanine/ornithine racemase family PLP-dependent enzyme [Tissierellia bacterium]|nr:alanine/ornithine racemase family PLP-dependent enzyme [Tissierellia bacterium]
MKYPAIEINLSKIRRNTEIVVNICKNYGIDVVGVTKVSNGSVDLAKAYIEGGVRILGDSRIENLKAYESLPVRKMLIRIPMLSEAEDVVRYADISLNSEIEVIRALSREAEKIGKVHEIILMIDVGDLREGIYYENEVFETVEEILKLKGVKLTGIGTNLTCFGAIIPSRENLGRLVDIKDKIERKFNISIEVISGGNSSSLCLIQKDEMPKGINQLRIGTALILGLIEVTWTRIAGTYIDAFKLIAEIVEIKRKPSKPIGEVAMDAFRNVPVFEDEGEMIRAICAIGKQDCDPNFMEPVDKRIRILGSSSDHLILDITKCKDDYKVGDTISFVLDYVAILRCMTSNHINKYAVEKGKVAYAVEEGK